MNSQIATTISAVSECGRRVGLGLNALAVSMALAFGLSPDASCAQSTSPAQINIPAQSLNQALLQLGQQTDIQIYYLPETVANLKAPAVSGTLTAEQALARLLRGTGIEVRWTGKTASLSRPAPEATQLAPVTVTGFLPGALPPAYAGGQVATGGQVGMLGNKDVMDTPFSQTNYTSQMIQDQQARTVQDVLNNDPSVVASTSNGTPHDYQVIRGFGGYGIDGTRTLNGLAGMAPLFFPSSDYIERVEILKGPSALLNGMTLASAAVTGAIGGSVNLVTKRAMDEPITQLTTRYVSKSQLGTHLDVGRRFGTSKQFGIRFIEAVARAVRWNTLLDGGTYKSVSEIAMAEGLKPTSVGRLMRLARLAPDIVEQLLAGTQPQRLTLLWLMRNDIPALWPDQRRMLDQFK